MAAAAGELVETVKYKGYVHVDRPEGGLPSLAAVQKGARLLNEKHQKTARAMHPLFARGLDTALELSISPAGLKVTLRTPEQKQAVVMNHQIHKIAYVLDVGSSVCFVVKRTGGKGRFNCHGFELSSAKSAHAVATKTAELCNSLFTKVRRVSHRVKRKSKVEEPSKPLPGIADEELKMVNEIAEADSKAVQDAVKEVEASDTPSPPAPAASEVAVVDFIDDLSDRLAQLVSGHGGSGAELTLDLDSDIFFLGEVGEMDC